MLNFIHEYIQWFWLSIAVLFTVIEVCSFGLTTIWFALGGIIMIFVSFLPIPFPWQILIFLVISTLLLIFTRPIAIKKLKVGKEKTNTDEIIGKTALVVKEITKFEKGEVKIKGIVWAAETANGENISVGTECIIESVHGVTLTVSPLPKEN